MKQWMLALLLLYPYWLNATVTDVWQPLGSRELEFNQLTESVKSRAPLQWQPVADCGCAPNIPAQASFVNFSYGFLPYVQTDEQKIDFGSLHRIGLYRFEVNTDNRLVLPPNWKNESKFNEFIRQAQAHNSHLDIVVSLTTSNLWQTPVAPKTLKNSIVEELTTPLKGYWLNDLQPLITLGLSAKRTLADGVTLDLNLTNLNEDSQIRVIDFISSLKRQLNPHLKLQLNPHLKPNLKPEVIASLNMDPKAFLDKELIELQNQNQKHEKIKRLKQELAMLQLATNTDTYFVNLTVPISALLNTDTEKNGFYTFENLLAIAPFVNLMLLTFDDKELCPISSEESVSCASKDKDAFRLRLTQLENKIDQSLNSVNSNILLEKMVPVFNMEKYLGKTDSFSNELLYANWNFSGVGLSDISNLKDHYEHLRRAFNTPVETSNPVYKTFLTASNTLCSFICPIRWQARLMLFSVVALLGLYVAVSAVVIKFSTLYQKPYFINFLLLLPFLVLLILWCDPFWYPYQNMVLLSMLLVTFLLNWFFRQQQRQRENYP